MYTKKRELAVPSFSNLYLSDKDSEFPALMPIKLKNAIQKLLVPLKNICRYLDWWQTSPFVFLFLEWSAKPGIKVKYPLLLK